jgi:hypothetical protein
MSCDAFYYQWLTKSNFVYCLLTDPTGACKLIGRCDHQARILLTDHKECQANPITEACYNMFNHGDLCGRGEDYLIDFREEMEFLWNTLQCEGVNIQA